MAGVVAIVLATFAAQAHPVIVMWLLVELLLLLLLLLVLSQLLILLSSLILPDNPKVWLSLKSKYSMIERMIHLALSFWSDKWAHRS